MTFTLFGRVLNITLTPAPFTYRDFSCVDVGSIGWHARCGCISIYAPTARELRSRIDDDYVHRLRTDAARGHGMVFKDNLIVKSIGTSRAMWGGPTCPKCQSHDTHERNGQRDVFVCSSCAHDWRVNG